MAKWGYIEPAKVSDHKLFGKFQNFFFETFWNKLLTWLPRERVQRESAESAEKKLDLTLALFGNTRAAQFDTF